MNIYCLKHDYNCSETNPAQWIVLGLLAGNAMLRCFLLWFKPRIGFSLHSCLLRVQAELLENLLFSGRFSCFRAGGRRRRRWEVFLWDSGLLIISSSHLPPLKKPYLSPVCLLFHFQPPHRCPPPMLASSSPPSSSSVPLPCPAASAAG